MPWLDILGTVIVGLACLRLGWVLAMRQRPKPWSGDVEELARRAYHATAESDAAHGHAHPSWEDLHASNRVRYLAIARAVAEVFV